MALPDIKFPTIDLSGIISPLTDKDNVKKAGEAFSTLAHIIQVSITKESTEAFKKMNKEFAMTGLKIWIPATLLLGVATTAMPLIYTYIQKVLVHNIGKPSLALKQRKITILNSLAAKLNPYYKPEIITKPVFKKEVEDQIQDIVNVTNNIQKNNSYFQNVIFYGPGGTGKTMIAEKIAREAGMNYMMMSGGELGQFIKRGEHVSELNKLFKTAKNSKKPYIIFVDEAEGFCMDRAKLDQTHLELQNTFLGHTGVPTKNFMIILATNRIKDIDRAILDRMAHKIHIDVPGEEQRAEIIDMYAKLFFLDKGEREKFFNKATIQNIAKKTENLSGRSLFYLINMMFAKKCGTTNNRLTGQIINNTVDVFVRQEKNLNIQT